MIVVARAGIEPATFRFSGGSDLRSETFVLVKLVSEHAVRPAWRIQSG
jgi:hypothetical protein